MKCVKAWLKQAQGIVLTKFVIEVPKNDFLFMEEGSTALLDRVTY